MYSVQVFWICKKSMFHKCSRWDISNLMQESIFLFYVFRTNKAIIRVTVSPPLPRIQWLLGYGEVVSNVLPKLHRLAEAGKPGKNLFLSTTLIFSSERKVNLNIFPTCPWCWHTGNCFSQPGFLGNSPVKTRHLSCVLAPEETEGTRIQFVPDLEIIFGDF